MTHAGEWMVRLTSRVHSGHRWGRSAGDWFGAHIARDEGVAAMRLAVHAAVHVDVATLATMATSAPRPASFAPRLARRRLRRCLCRRQGAEIELRHAELE